MERFIRWIIKTKKIQLSEMDQICKYDIGDVVALLMNDGSKELVTVKGISLYVEKGSMKGGGWFAEADSYNPKYTFKEKGGWSTEETMELVKSKKDQKGTGNN